MNEANPESESLYKVLLARVGDGAGDDKPDVISGTGGGKNGVITATDALNTALQFLFAG